MESVFKKVLKCIKFNFKIPEYTLLTLRLANIDLILHRNPCGIKYYTQVHLITGKSVLEISIMLKWTVALQQTNRLGGKMILFLNHTMKKQSTHLWMKSECLQMITLHTVVHFVNKLNGDI